MTPTPTPQTLDPAVSLACEVAKYYEGCELKPYLDPKNIPTIGYGSTFLLDGSPVTMDTPPITQDEADQMLYKVMASALAVVDKDVDRILNLPQAAALASFVYNVGAGAFGLSMLLQDLNENLTNTEIAFEMQRWVYAGHVREPGLVARRKTESNLFCTGNLVFYDGHTGEPVPGPAA